MLIFTSISFSCISLCICEFLNETDRVDYEEISSSFRYFARNLDRLLTTTPRTEKVGNIVIMALNQFNEVLESIISEVLMLKYDAVKFGVRLATEDDYDFMNCDIKKFAKTYKPLFQTFAPFDEHELYEVINKTRQYVRKLKTFPYPKLSTINRTDDYYTEYLADDYREFLRQAKILGH